MAISLKRFFEAVEIEYLHYDEAVLDGRYVRPGKNSDKATALLCDSILEKIGTANDSKWSIIINHREYEDKKKMRGAYDFFSEVCCALNESLRNQATYLENIVKVWAYYKHNRRQTKTLRIEFGETVTYLDCPANTDFSEDEEFLEDMRKSFKEKRLLNDFKDDAYAWLFKNSNTFEDLTKLLASNPIKVFTVYIILAVIPTTIEESNEDIIRNYLFSEESSKSGSTSASSSTTSGNNTPESPSESTSGSTPESTPTFEDILRLSVPDKILSSEENKGQMVWTVLSKEYKGQMVWTVLSEVLQNTLLNGIGEFTEAFGVHFLTLDFPEVFFRNLYNMILGPNGVPSVDKLKAIANEQTDHFSNLEERYRNDIQQYRSMFLDTSADKEEKRRKYQEEVHEKLIEELQKFWDDHKTLRKIYFPPAGEDGACIVKVSDKNYHWYLTVLLLIVFSELECPEGLKEARKQFFVQVISYIRSFYNDEDGTSGYPVFQYGIVHLLITASKLSIEGVYKLANYAETLPKKGECNQDLLETTNVSSDYPNQDPGHTPTR